MTEQHAIVGVWRVKTVGAPFAYHMFAFHADGTMQQSNPPLGNTETSDTAGLGVWKSVGKTVIKAHFEEFRLSYADTKTVTRGVVDFDITLRNNNITGTCEFRIFDPETDELLGGPHKATLTGQRVVLG